MTAAPHRLLARVLAVLVPVMMLGGAVSGTAAAAAPVLKCGATLTQNVVMTKDLTCAGNGLTLGSGVNLDMAGHKLVGYGPGVAISATDKSKHIVSNGTIRNWTYGVVYSGIEETLEYGSLTLTGVTISSAPLYATIADLTISNSTLTSSPVHLWVTTAKVTNSTLRQSSTDGEMNVISLQGSSIVGGGLGQDENNTVTVKGSTMNGIGFTGSPTFCSTTIVNSTIKNYAQPIVAFDGCGLTVSGSTFSNNKVAVLGGGIVVTTTTFTGNTTGVELDFPAGSSITGSTFTSNTGSGIHTTRPGLKVGSNTAIGNGGYGIYAPGAIDLGKNVARNNGAGNCVGVTCAAK